MSANTKPGFCYALEEQTIRNYRDKPLELRLRWLYMGNLLRQHYPERIRRLQDSFRNPLENDLLSSFSDEH